MADELQTAGLAPPDPGRRALSTRKRKNSSAITMMTVLIPLPIAQSR